MLKIEPAKNFTAASKRELTKTSGGNSEGQSFDSAGEVGEDGGGDFARVLENLTAKKDSPNKEPDAAKPKESEKDFRSKFDQHSKENQPHKAKSDARLTSGEDAAGAAAARTAANENSPLETELPVPPARAILHIADLERIVSSVRTQAFDGNSQIVITLKNSVCSGLQIKLTTDENHRVTAEFIAANEKVKAQIDARSGELADLLKQRGVKLASLQTSVGSETSGGNQDQRQSEELEKLGSSASTFKKLENQPELTSEVNETINTYRV